MAVVRPELSKRIEALRVICIVGVIIVHTAPPEDFGEAFFAPWAKFLYVFFSCGFCRAGVPMLSIISGYLAVRAYGETSYLDMLGKKWKTLLLPAILWGVLTAVPALVLQSTGLLSANTFEMADGGYIVWLDAIFGLDKGPMNTALYFLYDLFLCFAALPAFYFVLRKAALAGGLVLLAALLFDIAKGAYLRPDIVLGFYVGGFIAMRGLDPFRLDRYRLPCLAAFVAACAVVAWYGMLLPAGALEEGLRGKINGLRLIGPPAMWAVVSYIAPTRLYGRVAGFGKHSFFVYCFHSPVMRLLARAWFTVATRFPPQAYLLFYVLAAPLTIAFALVCAAILRRTAGGVLAILSGSRLGNRAAFTPVRAAALGRE